MAQPTNRKGNPKSIWDEKNQNWLFEEISHFSELAINSGAGNSESEILDLKKNTLAQFQVVEDTGTITGAVATLQHSVDGVNFINTAATVSGAGVSSQVAVGRYVRIKFTTNSVGASTADVTIVGR